MKRLRTPYPRHFHMGYGIFSLWFTELWLTVHWIIMKTCRILYENAWRTESASSLMKYIILLDKVPYRAWFSLRMTKCLHHVASEHLSLALHVNIETEITPAWSGKFKECWYASCLLMHTQWCSWGGKSGHVPGRHLKGGAEIDLLSKIIDLPFGNFWSDNSICSWNMCKASKMYEEVLRTFFFGGAPISLLALGARNPCYTTVHTHILTVHCHYLDRALSFFHSIKYCNKYCKYYVQLSLHEHNTGHDGLAMFSQSS